MGWYENDVEHGRGVYHFASGARFEGVFSKVGVMDREFSIISTANLSPFATNMDVGFPADFTLFYG